MVEIRTHGRGGQGAVIASKVLANALFRENRFIQAFPAFGVERRGAPVVAFTRFDSVPIRLRCEIYEPDHLIVLDHTLTETIDVTAGLKAGGWIIINSRLEPGQFSLASSFRIATVDASAIAQQHGLGSRAAPIVNTAILGAFSRATGLVGMEAVVGAIQEYVPVKPEANVKAAQDAFERVQVPQQAVL